MTKTKNVIFRLDEETRDQLEYLADLWDCTMSEAIRRMIGYAHRKYTRRVRKGYGAQPPRPTSPTRGRA